MDRYAIVVAVSNKLKALKVKLQRWNKEVFGM